METGFYLISNGEIFPIVSFPFFSSSTSCSSLLLLLTMAGLPTGLPECRLTRVWKRLTWRNIYKSWKSRFFFLTCCCKAPILPTWERLSRCFLNFKGSCNMCDVENLFQSLLTEMDCPINVVIPGTLWRKLNPRHLDFLLFVKIKTCSVCDPDRGFGSLNNQNWSNLW